MSYLETKFVKRSTFWVTDCLPLTIFGIFLANNYLPLNVTSPEVTAGVNAASVSDVGREPMMVGA